VRGTKKEEIQYGPDVDTVAETTAEDAATEEIAEALATTEAVEALAAAEALAIPETAA
jgi:hypothetical protein